MTKIIIIMKTRGREILLFDNRAETSEIIAKFIIIIYEMNQSRMPPIGSLIRRRLLEKYQIDATEEEIEELREYVMSEFIEEAGERINEEYRAGIIEPVDPKDRTFFDVSYEI